MIVKLENTKPAHTLFSKCSDTLVLSCLQKVMGGIYADSLTCPTSAMAIAGAFCFLAGKPSEELVLFKPQNYSSNFVIMIPENEEWAKLIENSYGEKTKRVTRYAIKKEQDIFNREKLKKYVANLPAEYTIQLIDEPLYEKCKNIAWCSDWVSQFDTYNFFKAKGLGVVILKDGEPVSGASSYTAYNEGIEIEIDTHEDYRQKGLATICGAKLILECLDRNLCPSWDAQNKWSVALAEKLGYNYSHSYAAYEIYAY